MTIEKSDCGLYVRVLFNGHVVSMVTIEEWSQIIANPGEFVKRG